MCKWPINGLDSEIKLWSTTATDRSVFELTGLSFGLFWNNKNPMWYAHPSQHGVAGGETPRLSSVLDDKCPPPWPLESPETQSGPPTAIMPKSRYRHPFFPHFPSVWTGKDGLVTEDSFISLIRPDGDTVQDKWHGHKLTASFKISPAGWKTTDVQQWNRTSSVPSTSQNSVHFYINLHKNYFWTSNGI